MLYTYTWVKCANIIYHCKWKHIVFTDDKLINLHENYWDQLINLVHYNFQTNILFELLLLTNATQNLIYNNSTLITTS